MRKKKQKMILKIPIPSDKYEVTKPWVCANSTMYEGDILRIVNYEDTDIKYIIFENVGTKYIHYITELIQFLNNTEPIIDGE